MTDSACGCEAALKAWVDGKRAGNLRVSTGRISISDHACHASPARCHAIDAIDHLVAGAIQQKQRERTRAIRVLFVENSLRRVPPTDRQRPCVQTTRPISSHAQLVVNDAAPSSLHSMSISDLARYTARTITIHLRV